MNPIHEVDRIAALVTDRQPHAKGTLNVSLSDNRRSADVLHIRAIDPEGMEIWTWSWLFRGPDPKSTKLSVPETGIALLHGIPPIGTKFQKPDRLGPAGQTNTASGRYHGKVWFHFDL